MFAVIKTGGKQYKVQVGETIDVELLDVEEGAQVRLDQVLLAASDSDVAYGRPLIDGAVVTARVVRQHKGPKLIVFRYKSKSRYRRRTGHRQKLTQLVIQTIDIPGWETARIEKARAATPATEVTVAASSAGGTASAAGAAASAGGAAPTADVATPASAMAAPATDVAMPAPEAALPAADVAGSANDVSTPAAGLSPAPGSAAPPGDALPTIKPEAQVEATGAPRLGPLATRPGMEIDEPSAGLPGSKEPPVEPAGQSGE